jgi:DMSO/TMAO reductase YedYZ molybdopterin-dependent catalytic subunit
MMKSRFRPSPLFRPTKMPDPSILDEHRALIRSIERRKLIRGGLSLGGLSMLTGCDISDSTAVGKALRAISSFNDVVQAAIFDPNKLAPEYPASMVLKPPRFNAYYEIENVKPVDGESWRLELAGLIDNKQPWTRQQIAALPQREMIIRHICIEGWDYIGQWSGVPLRTFLERVGADLTARYVAFRTADDYPSSIDMATALHPQTLLATQYAGETLADPFGYPLRLRTSTKLGFKNPKWITAIEVTNTYPVGYWESRGFNWQSSI